MLQQGELRVMRWQESPTGVHLDSEVGWVKRMHLCIEGSIKISYRKIEMFYLPSHSIALITQLSPYNGATTGSKQVSVLGFAVEVVDVKTYLEECTTRYLGFKCFLFSVHRVYPEVEDGRGTLTLFVLLLFCLEFWKPGSVLLTAEVVW